MSPQYKYEANVAGGRTITGQLHAPSKERAEEVLRSHGYTPLSVNPAKSLLNLTVYGGRVGTRELIMFSRQLSSMIGAGVPVLQAIQSLARQSNKANFRSLLEEIAYDVESGQPFSQSLTKHPDIFSPFFLGVVRTGEASGRLSEVLASISDHLEQDYSFIRKVRAALMYPVFVLIVAIFLSIIMLMFIMPQLADLFADANIPLPLPTRILLFFTTFTQRFWYLLVIAVVIGAFILRSYLKTPEGRFTISSFILRIPGINTLFQKIYLARLTSLLHTLFLSSVPVIQALSLARSAVSNQVYQRILNRTIKSVRDGSTISSVWRNELYIPPMLTAMISVGERSGNVAEAFSEAHKFFKADVEDALGSITVLLEPILVIGLGVGVGIIVAAVILPIYNLVLVL